MHLYYISKSSVITPSVENESISIPTWPDRYGMVMVWPNGGKAAKVFEVCDFIVNTGQ